MKVPLFVVLLLLPCCLSLAHPLVDDLKVSAAAGAAPATTTGTTTTTTTTTAPFHFGLQGLVVRWRPEQGIRLFMDGTHWNVSSLEVRVAAHRDPSVLVENSFRGESSLVSSLSSEEEYQKCTNITRISQDFVQVYGCPLLQVGEEEGESSGAAYSFQLEASVESLRAPTTLRATTQSNITWIQLPGPVPAWPLENERGVWPPQVPNAVGNLFEDYQTFGGIDRPYWHQGEYGWRR